MAKSKAKKVSLPKHSSRSARSARSRRARLLREKREAGKLPQRRRRSPPKRRSRSVRRSPSAKKRSLSARAARSQRARRLREKREAGTLPRRRRRSPAKSKPRKRSSQADVLNTLVKIVSASDTCGNYSTEATCPDFVCDWDETTSKCQKPSTGVVGADEELVALLGSTEDKAMYYTTNYFKVKKQLEDCLSREKVRQGASAAPAVPPPGTFAAGPVNVLVPRRKPPAA